MTEPPQQPGAEPGGYPAYGPPPQRRERSTGVIVAVALVVAALIVGGAFLIPRLLKDDKGAGPAATIAEGPERLAPANAFSFTRIDTNVSDEQKKSIAEFLGRFPGVPRVDPDDPFGSLVTAGLRRSGADVDYARDIAPWFGGRIGVAAVAAGRQPTPVVFIESNNDAKAREFLTKSAQREDARFVFDIRDHFVVGAQTRDVLQAALSGPRLKDDANYKAALNRLRGEQAITFYSDLQKTLQGVPALRARLGVAGAFAGGLLSGQLAMGVSFESDYLQFEGAAVNTRAGGLKGSSTSLLTNLPSDTPLALAVSNLGTLARTALQFGGGARPVQEFEQRTGLSLANDVAPLFADTTVVAVAAGAERREVGLATKVSDEGKARSVLQRLQPSLQRGNARGDVRNGTMYLATADFLDAIESDGGLGDDDVFQKAMGELPDNLVAAVYLNFERVPDLARRSGAIGGRARALGLSIGVSDGVPTFRLRLVAK